MRYQIKDITFNTKLLYEDLKGLGVSALSSIDDLTPIANRWNIDNGYKLIGNELDYYLDHEALTVSEDNISLIARSIFYRFGVKWNKEYEAFMTEYNPVHNYDRHEEYTDTTTKTGTYDDENSGIDRTANGNEQTSEVAAFDLDTLKTDNVVTDKGDTTLTHGKKTTHTQNLKDEVKHEAHLYGNIGVTTSQQMIESEFVLRNKYKLLDIISNDIREALTLKIYRLSDE